MVLNAQEWINTAKALSNVGRIRAYGYYGSPSASAVTLYDQISFTVFALQKDGLRSISKLIMMLDLPISF